MKDFFVTGNLSVGRQEGSLDVKGAINLGPPSVTATNSTVAFESAYSFKMGGNTSNNSMVITKGSDPLELFKFQRGDDDVTTLHAQAPEGKAAEIALGQGSRNFTMRYEGAADELRYGLYNPRWVANR